MSETKDYPLPTVHLNGTDKRTLLWGNIKIQKALSDLSDALNDCTFHGRDYYVQDIDDTVIGGAYGLALEERQKHIENLLAFKQYNLEQVMHLRSQ